MALSDVRRVLLIMLRHPIAVCRLVLGLMAAMTLMGIGERFPCFIILVTEAILVYYFIHRNTLVTIDHIGQEIRADRRSYYTTGLITCIIVIIGTLWSIFYAVLLVMENVAKTFYIVYCCVLGVFAVGEFVHFWACDSFEWEINEAIGGSAANPAFTVIDGTPASLMPSLFLKTEQDDSIEMS